MSVKSIILIITGVLFIIIGWVYLLNGIEVKTCSTYVHIPREFIGRFRPEFSETHYWRNVVVNLSDIELKSNVLYTYQFNLSDALGYIQINIEGVPMNSNYRGYIAIVDIEKNQIVVNTDLNPFKSVNRDNIDITLFFMRSLSPGVYQLQLSLDTDALIKTLVIHGPSSIEVEVHGIEIRLEPASGYQMVKIDYVCDISFVQALVASVLIGIGMTTTIAGAFIESIITSIKAKNITSIPRTKKK